MNLDNLLGEALRGGITSNKIIQHSSFLFQYENGEYESIIAELQGINVSDWNEEMTIIFLKCYIHVYDEKDEIIKDLMILSFLKMNEIHFSGLGKFRIHFPSTKFDTLFSGNESMDEWQKYLEIIEGNFSFLFENVERFKKYFIIKNNIRDNLGLFILSCFELYDMKSEYYPLFKWLFQIHFKPHH